MWCLVLDVYIKSVVAIVSLYWRFVFHREISSSDVESFIPARPDLCYKTAVKCHSVTLSKSAHSAQHLTPVALARAKPWSKTEV